MSESTYSNNDKSNIIENLVTETVNSKVQEIPSRLPILIGLILINNVTDNLSPYLTLLDCKQKDIFGQGYPLMTSETAKRMKQCVFYSGAIYIIKDSFR